MEKGKSLKHFVLNEASSGMIANKTRFSSYKDIDGVRLAAVQILNRDGDREYSVKAFSDLIREAADEYAENKHESQFAKGGKTKMSPQAIFKKYEENEDDNYHGENVVLLAQHFGTADDLKKAKQILKEHERSGSLPQNLYEQRHKLHQKLYPKLVAAMGNKMATGGGVLTNYTIVFQNAKGQKEYHTTEAHNKAEAMKVGKFLEKQNQFARGHFKVAKIEEKMATGGMTKGCWCYDIGGL